MDVALQAGQRGP